MLMILTSIVVPILFFRACEKDMKVHETIMKANQMDMERFGRK